MGTFNKLKRSRKSSHLDEKIEFLNKELEKTGVILETPANSTASIYNTTEFVPGLPQITSQVPDATGFANGDSQDANGGDESNPDTWEDGWNDITDMKNPNNLNGVTNRNIPLTPDLSGWVPVSNNSVSGRRPSISGGAGIGVWTISAGIGGGRSIGTLTANNEFVQILIPDNIFGTYNYPSWPKQGWASGSPYGPYSTTEYEAARNIAIAYQNNRYTSSWVSRKCWVNYAQATSHGGPSYAEYTGAKKTTVIQNFDGTYRTLYWKLKDVSILVGSNSYISQDGTPDARTTMFRTGLDDGEYYPGSMSGFMDFLKGALGASKQALDWLMGKAGEVVDAAQDAVDQFMNELEGNESTLPPKVKDFIQDTKDSSLAQAVVDNILEPFREKIAEKKVTPAAFNFFNYVTNSLPAELDNDYLNFLEDGYVDDVISNGHIQDDGTFYAGENIVGTAQVPREDGDYVEIDFNMGFKNNIEEFEDKEVTLVQQALYDFLGPYSADAQTFTGIIPLDLFAGAVLGQLIDNAKSLGGAQDKPGTLRISKEKLKELNSTMYSMLVNDGIITEGVSLSEGWESPKHVGIDKDEKKRWFKEKDVAPIYPKKAPPKLVRGYHPDMLPKLDTPIPQIKVSKKDLIRAHILSEFEAQEWIDKIDRLNDYIARNPDILAYARERYPVSDPHLAALNYKMDMQLAASDEYIEKQFPENIRLYNKVLDATKKSIKLTDPKTFKSEKGVFTTFNKLARVQHVDTVYQPKERTLKLKKRTKNSVNRFLFKPKEKTKDDILKDKLAVLDKEMQKTMPDT